MLAVCFLFPWEIDLFCVTHTNEHAAHKHIVSNYYIFSDGRWNDKCEYYVCTMSFSLLRQYYFSDIM